uniref:Ig-like domain-containing protein n=1 Tax=Hippocampus comes TaxID=109280 RepID=A0A3Q2Y628_HIPCM
MEECGESRPQDCPELTSDWRISQTGEHKFISSLDALAQIPRVVKALESLNCPEGQTAMLECVVTAEPSPPEVTWFCNDILLETTAGKYRAEVDGLVHKLYVSSFTRTDVGVYKCVAKNKVGEGKSTDLCSFEFQKKKEKPVFLTQLSSVAAIAGESATFSVKVSGIPKPTVQWSRDGKTIKSSSVYKLVEEKEEFTLIINRVTSEHQGEYSCTASNRFGQTTCSTYLEVKKEDLSQAEKWVEKMFQYTEVRFHYQVVGDPVPKVQWFKGTVEIQSSPKRAVTTNPDGSGFITVKDVTQEDSGMYTCKASNQFGEASSGAELVVLRESRSVSHKQQVEVQKKSYKVSKTEQATESRLYQVSLPGQDGVRTLMESGQFFLLLMTTNTRNTFSSTCRPHNATALHQGPKTGRW